MTDLTLVTALGAAVAALAGAVAVLWKDTRDRHSALESRTESHLAVATKQMEVLALMGERIAEVEKSLNRLAIERGAQITDLSRKIDANHESDQLQHSGQMRVLSAIEARLMPPMTDPIRRRPETGGSD